MRYFHFSLAVIPTMMLVTGCSQLDSANYISPPEQIREELSESPEMKAIKNYLTNNANSTRSDDIELYPITEDGDTLMYLAQHTSGWELFSNSITAPMVLMKSETGNFENCITSNPVFSDLYRMIGSSLKADKEKSEDVFEIDKTDWIFYNHEFGSTEAVSDFGEEGIYTLVGTKTFPTDHRIVNHLLRTHWHQSSPCNNYMPFQKYATSDHIYLGCTTVATGQFLYYTHYKWGTPSVSPSKVAFDSSNNKYNFSNPSTEQWNKIPLYPLDNDTSLPLFLGWIAKEINAEPKYSNNEHTGTGASISDAANFIYREARIPCECISYNLNIVTDKILNSSPVILWLTRSGGGHTVVIDALDYTEYSYDKYYAYVKPSVGTDPSQPIGPDIGTTDDYDYFVSKYGHIYTEHYSSKNIFFQFNWGWKDGPDSILINGAVLDISTDYNDISGYKMYQIINYSLN